MTTPGVANMAFFELNILYFSALTSVTVKGMFTANQ